MDGVRREVPEEVCVWLERGLVMGEGEGEAKDMPL